MKKLKNPVVIYDSGIGGLTVLYNLLAHNPQFDIVYFADYKGAPYGSKSPVILRKKILENLKLLDNIFAPQGFVLACNTATAVAAGVARRAFPQKFIIGTEPALMPTITEGKRDILLLSTPNTAKYNKLVRQQEMSENIRLEIVARAGLATAIEENIENIAALKSDLRRILAPFNTKIDSLVLGCTHYIYLRPILREILSSDIKIYDGNGGVARQIMRKAEPSRSSKLIVVTNDITRKNNLVAAWSFLKERGEQVCVE